MNIQKRSRIWLSGLKLAALAVMCGSLASADVLYWSDFTLATSSIPGGITLAGLTGVAATSELAVDERARKTRRDYGSTARTRRLPIPIREVTADGVRESKSGTVEID